MSEIAVQARRTRKFPTKLALAATALLAAAALAGVTLSGRNDGTAWAAALVKVAESAPRLLVDEPGWSVTRADEFGVGYGEMTFSNGDRQLEVHWERGTDFGAKLADPGSGWQALGTTSVQGAQARLFRAPEAPEFLATWSHGGYGLQARGLASDQDEFEALVATLREVSVDGWLSAMPASVITPEGRSKVVLAMLDGVPLPAGFRVAPLLHGEVVKDRYQLGAQVSGAVACAWIKRLVTARHTGDAVAVRQAIGALASSHDWRVLHDMQAEGAYPDVLWQYSDAAAANAPVMGGKELSVEASYRQALGCPAG